MVSFRTEIPDPLWQQALEMVEQGRAGDMQSLLIESLRCYLDAHQDVVSEQFIREDVEWGLHGGD